MSDAWTLDEAKALLADPFPRQRVVEALAWAISEIEASDALLDRLQDLRAELAEERAEVGRHWRVLTAVQEQNTDLKAQLAEARQALAALLDAMTLRDGMWVMSDPDVWKAAFAAAAAIGETP